MDILVCIKQVPGTSNVEVDPVTGVLKRDGVESKLNPYDLYALEQAFALKELYGGMVRTVTMGPPQAKAAVMESVYMGADSGVVINLRAQMCWPPATRLHRGCKAEEGLTSSFAANRRLTAIPHRWGRRLPSIWACRM